MAMQQLDTQSNKIIEMSVNYLIYHWHGEIQKVRAPLAFTFRSKLMTL